MRLLVAGLLRHSSGDLDLKRSEPGPCSSGHLCETKQQVTGQGHRWKHQGDHEPLPGVEATQHQDGRRGEERSCGCGRAAKTLPLPSKIPGSVVSGYAVHGALEHEHRTDHRPERDEHRNITPEDPADVAENARSQCCSERSTHLSGCRGSSQAIDSGQEKRRRQSGEGDAQGYRPDVDRTVEPDVDQRDQPQAGDGPKGVFELAGVKPVLLHDNNQRYRWIGGATGSAWPVLSETGLTVLP
ncbi:MAG: hypothetical protein QOH36_1859 [Actinomycetota bacterium]|nr:hypothetical protein [Actinomycetota bacterium]